MRLALLPILALALWASPALATESAYTKVDFEADCTAVDEDELGGSWTCRGFEDYPIHFSEGDLRQSAFYGHVGSWYETGAFESFGPFNHAGPTVEWRIEDGLAFATIRRWFVAREPDANGNPGPETQVLVISRVGQKGDGEACVVGYVEATANKYANAIARRVADEDAHDFACRYSEPGWHGERRARVEPMRHFEEMGE